MISKLMKYLEYPAGLVVGYFLLKAYYDLNVNKWPGIYACLIDEEKISETVTMEDLLEKAKENCTMKGIEGMHLTHVNYFLVHDAAIGTVMITIIYQVIWYIVYKLNHPWIEQYKALPNEPWPWNNDPEGWKI